MPDPIKKCADHLPAWVSEKMIKRKVCPLCGAEASGGTIKRNDQLSIIQCAHCPMAYVDSIPDIPTLNAYYDTGYFLGKKSFFTGSDYCHARHQAVLSGRPVTGYREIISDFNPKGKDILEIGCSSGALLQQLKAHMPNSLLGLDFAQWPIDYGKRMYGLDLRCSSLENERFSAESFDLVIMVDVLEHVPEPLSLTQKINRMLRPRGMLFVITPNFGAFLKAKINWIQLSTSYEHLQYFSRESLALLGERTSFHIKRVYTQGLPISLRQYPEGSNHRFEKYFLYPHIAAINLYRKLYYGKVANQGGGNDLIAFLEKKQGTMNA